MSKEILIENSMFFNEFFSKKPKVQKVSFAEKYPNFNINEKLKQIQAVQKAGMQVLSKDPNMKKVLKPVSLSEIKRDIEELVENTYMKYPADKFPKTTITIFYGNKDKYPSSVKGKYMDDDELDVVNAKISKFKSSVKALSKTSLSLQYSQDSARADIYITI